MSPAFSFRRSSRYRLTSSLVTAAFFVLFLLIFLPFGVNNYDPNHRYSGEFLLFISAFGISTGTVMLLNEFLLAPRLPLSRSWLGVLGWWAWLWLWVGSVNFLLYNWAGSWHDLHWMSWAGFVVNCASVMIFPLLGCHYYFQQSDMRERFESELGRQRSRIDPAQLLTFGGSGQSDQIVLRVSDFLCAHAQDNYVELRYLVGDQLHSHLLRATIAGLAELTAAAGIVRCHRSVLVNLRRVVAVRGSGQRLQLLLDAGGESVPVSRTYAETTLTALAELGLTPAAAAD